MSNNNGEISAEQLFKDKNAGPTIETVAELIKSGKAKKIMIMCGAGISTAAGIPDFRSPGTGIYNNLRKYNLPYPEAIFDIDYFKENPEPFYALAKELYPTKFKPTLTHYFITLLHRKNILLRCFTQNIDTLERIAGLPDDKIVEAHGSFARSECLHCYAEADPDRVREAVFGEEIPKCSSCKVGLVKPCITFFGECLPVKFFEYLDDFLYCDLLIVIGTSLQVQPFASLVDRVESPTIRLLINREPIYEYFDFEGIYSEISRDAFYKGDCDDGIRKLAELIGWQDELEELYTIGHSKIINYTPETVEKKSENLDVSISKDDKIDGVSEKALEDNEQVSDKEVDKLSEDIQKISINIAADESDVKIERLTTDKADEHL
ncbi:5942_t:CDS:2 [Acaulospora morrowiae]|uniref:NAD-dependent protein deacetylase n=1 Tax=Acaulospora morrowiae TaxID=94023 RepID=A0A9N9DIT0_9GLOM|nr:5942_t:CDS:2 [Acaulospora morrowiae]